MWLTFAKVDLDAVAGNVRTLISIAKSASVMAVVKADGYGHGMVPVARAAIEAGASWLGVYSAQEGVALRANQVEAPILVFGPFSAYGAREIVRWRLTPTVTSIASAKLLSEATNGDRLTFHLKVDTGLTRSGVPTSETLSLLERVSRLPGITVGGVYTHLACADDPSLSTTVEQLDLFDETLRNIERRGHQIPLRHAANTAATLNFSRSRYGLVRTGIGLYGYDPSLVSTTQGRSLRPVMSLHSRITKTTRVPAGTGVGYGHSYRTVRPTTIALVPIGYGDGVFRCLGQGRGSVLIRGQNAPIVGRISMDQITVDVSEIGASEGEPVTIIGEQEGKSQSAADVAAEAGTISYEVLCRIAPRVPRIYLQGGSARAIELGASYVSQVAPMRRTSP